MIVFLSVAVGSLVALTALILWQQALLALRRTWEFRVIGATLESAIYRQMAGIVGEYKENGFLVKIDSLSSDTIAIELIGTSLKKGYTFVVDGGED